MSLKTRLDKWADGVREKEFRKTALAIGNAVANDPGPWLKIIAASPKMRTMDPAVKVELLEAMGFIPMGEAHTRDCPANQGNRCNCVPGPTEWAQPKDVNEYRGETWQDRLAKRHAEKRSRDD